MKASGFVAVSAWLFVTVVAALIIWVTQRMDIWNFLYIIILTSGAFAVSLIIPGGYQPSMKPLKEFQAQLSEISSKIAEIDRKLDEIKKTLEE